MKVIDLNADVGEGAGNDAWLVPLVTSVNIACGAHAGDARTMRETLALAAEHHVVAGAHPGFADRAQMGRRDLDLTRPELIELVTNQLAALHEYGEFHYVKPHGALYTMAARDAAIAEAIAVAVKQFDATLVLMGLAGSQLVQAGREAGLRVVQEAFADRRYDAAGQLLARGQPGAIITDEAEAVAQVLALVRGEMIAVAGGRKITIAADSICLHGDNQSAVKFARRLRTELATAGVTVRSFIS